MPIYKIWNIFCAYFIEKEEGKNTLWMFNFDLFFGKESGPFLRTHRRDLILEYYAHAHTYNFSFTGHIHSKKMEIVNFVREPNFIDAFCVKHFFFRFGFGFW